jgi:hypothetical protein
VWAAGDADLDRVAVDDHLEGRLDAARPASAAKRRAPGGRGQADPSGGQHGVGRPGIDRRVRTRDRRAGGDGRGGAGRGGRLASRAALAVDPREVRPRGLVRLAGDAVPHAVARVPAGIRLAGQAEREVERDTRPRGRGQGEERGEHERPHGAVLAWSIA